MQNTMSSAMSQASFVFWNNQGVDCMEHGKHSEAIDAFSKALLILRNSIKAVPKDCSDIGMVAVNVGPFVSLTRQYTPAHTSLSPESSSMDIDDGTETKPLHAAQQNSSAHPASPCGARDDNAPIRYLYDQTVSFSDELERPETYASRPIMRALSVLVIFNLGLAHHIVVERRLGDDKSLALLHARTIRLYEMALKSQRACLQSMGADGFRLLLALHNNLGRAQEPVDSGKAEACWRTLLSLLLWSTQQQQRIAVPEGFWHSVSHLLLPHPAPAAAA